MPIFDENYFSRPEAEGAVGHDGISIRARLAADFMVQLVANGHEITKAAGLAVMATLQLETELEKL